MGYGRAGSEARALTRLLVFNVPVEGRAAQVAEAGHREPVRHEQVDTARFQHAKHLFHHLGDVRQVVLTAELSIEKACAHRSFVNSTAILG